MKPVISKRKLNPYVLVIVLPLAIMGCIMLTNARHDIKPAIIAASSAQTFPATSAPNLQPTPVESTLAPVSYLGTLFAHESVDIAAKIEGRLDEVYVGLGDHIKAQTVIARLDPLPIQQELKVSEASAQAAQSELHKAQLELVDAQERYARRVTLAESGVLSQEEMLTAKRQVEIIATNVDIARARVAEREALIAQIKERLAGVEIRSPYDGIISARHQNPGALITRGEPIVSMSKSDDLWVRFALPSDQIHTVGAGATVMVRIESLGATIPGSIEQIAPNTDAALQIVMVEARLQAPDATAQRLQPGFVGQVFLNPTAR